MTVFISRAACHGRRPNVLTPRKIRERPVLMTLLLRNREVARFIVAPDGYGKTSCALEYAETIFDWARVYWINAASPCFLRDLDAGVIAEACFSYDDKASLVVFDDLPMLDDERVQLFSRQVDELLSHGCEVIATCVPTCDRTDTIQPDGICVKARDLLLADDELQGFSPYGDRLPAVSGYTPAAKRIAGLVWAPEEIRDQFSRGVLGEEMPADLLLAMASTLVFGHGTFDDIASIASVSRDVIAPLLDDYPHLGFTQDIDVFEAPEVSVASLSFPLRKYAKKLLSRSTYETFTEIVYAWATQLVHMGRGDRACALIGEVCPRFDRAQWMLSHADELVRRACFFPLVRIARDRDCSKGHTRMRLSALEALCRCMLGDETGGLKSANRHAFDDAAPLDARLLSLLVIARKAQEPLVSEACEYMASIVPPDYSDASGCDARWLTLARACLAANRGVDVLAGDWATMRETGVDDETLCVCASWLFSMAAEAEETDLPRLATLLRPVERFVRSRLDSQVSQSVDYYTASAGLALEEAREHGLMLGDGPLRASALIRLHEVALNILNQRRAYDEDAQARSLMRGDWAATHPDALLTQSRERIVLRVKHEVPLLNVRLFGCFEARVGDSVIEPYKFKRSTARSLLAMLALSEGREISRETIAASLWPYSPGELGKKNFYTVWSQLRHVLMLPDGTCPYLVRHQYGCSIDPKLVRSDVSRLNEICRDLLFGVPGPEQWSQLYTEVNRDFSYELMPSDRKNPFISRARNDYQNRLVDALVSATISATEQKSPRWGIWFGREALAHDDTREDAYVALIRAQKAAEQRTAAMDTYLRCRRVLSEKLGIDPSPETRRLYESLLDSDISA